MESEDSEEVEEESEGSLVEGLEDVCIGDADGKDGDFMHGESLGDFLRWVPGVAVDRSTAPSEALEQVEDSGSRHFEISGNGGGMYVISFVDEVSSNNDGASESGSENDEITGDRSGISVTGLEGAVKKGVSGEVGDGCRCSCGVSFGDSSGPSSGSKWSGRIAEDNTNLALLAFVGCL